MTVEVVLVLLLLLVVVLVVVDEECLVVEKLVVVAAVDGMTQVVAMLLLAQRVSHSMTGDACCGCHCRFGSPCCCLGVGGFDATTSCSCCILFGCLSGNDCGR